MMTRLDPKNLSLRGRKNFYHIKIGEVRAEAQGLLPFFFAFERKKSTGKRTDGKVCKFQFKANSGKQEGPSFRKSDRNVHLRERGRTKNLVGTLERRLST